MDLKQAKIMSASMIGIFAVVGAIIVLNSRNDKWLKVADYTDYDDILSYCFGYVGGEGAASAGLAMASGDAALANRMSYALEVTLAVQKRLPNQQAIKDGQQQFNSDWGFNPRAGDDIYDYADKLETVRNKNVYKICQAEVTYFFNGKGRPADAPKIKPKEEPVKWCYATYAPHGAIWSSHCYDSKKECKSDLNDDRAEGRTINTKSCYKYEEISGYCIDDVYTGETRLDDFDNSEYKVVTQVCTKTLDECAKFTNYQSEPSDCYSMTISTRESEENHLTPDNVKKKILETEPAAHDAVTDSKSVTDKQINNNGNKKSSKGTDTKGVKKSASSAPNKCNDFRHAENQQKAFEKLGLDWNKTKNWGAFVDVDGILRADKPSCREIVKDSQEYNKYKRK